MGGGNAALLLVVRNVSDQAKEDTRMQRSSEQRGQRVCAEDALIAAIFGDEPERRIVRNCWENRRVLTSRAKCRRGQRPWISWPRFWLICKRRVERGQLTAWQADRLLMSYPLIFDV
jgi:hypothetical protein